MMYNQKLVASIKANGKILREFKDTVYIPFSSEYSILIKNLDTVRALVNVYIDGENVVPGGLVLYAGQEIDLERSIKSGNLNEGNRFKFIERTGAVEQHRGVKLEDGIVRIEYQFEELFRRFSGWYKSEDSLIDRTRTPFYNVNGTLRSVDLSHGDNIRAKATSAVNRYSYENNITAASASVHDGSATMDWCANDVGITVPGSKSDQKFHTAQSFPVRNEKYTIILKLLGETENNKPVLEPVTVKHRPKCVTCGKQNKATAKFCSECGTALEIFV